MGVCFLVFVSTRMSVCVCVCVCVYICVHARARARVREMQPFTQVDLHNLHGEVLLDEQVGVRPEGVQHGQHPLLIV